jgi:hypothetical protein
MHEGNQGLPDPGEIAPPDLAPSTAPEAAMPRDLLPWFVIVTVAGVGSLVTGHAELAGLAALAGLFAVAHAADLDPARLTTYRALAWVVPVGSAWAFGSLALVLVAAELPPSSRIAGQAVAVLGAVASVVMAFRPAADALARALFGGAASSRVERLAARLIVAAVFLSVPAGLAFPIAADLLEETGTSLVGGAAGLWGNLAGLVLLALGAVGFTVRRDLPATLDRLGLAPLRLPDLTPVLGGVVALIAVNAGAEWIQSTWFHDLWVADQRVNRLIAGSLSRPEILLLGLSAGFGEEIALRGALQPRLGIFRTSVLFALLHVQYSWFGMLIIAALGLLLGWIRQRTSTSVAIVVHALYDVAAVVTGRM